MLKSQHLSRPYPEVNRFLEQMGWTMEIHCVPGEVVATFGGEIHLPTACEARIRGDDIVVEVVGEGGEEFDSLMGKTLLKALRLLTIP